MTSNTHIQIRINRNVSIAVLASLLAHILMLFLLSHYDLLKSHPPAMEQNQTLDVVLELPQAKSRKKAAKKSAEQPSYRPRRERAAKIKSVDSRAIPLPPPATPAPQAAPPPTHPQAPAPPKPTAPTAEKYTDLASYMAAARERRLLAGDPGAINEDATARESSEDATRAARRNIQPAGTNGIFNILSINKQSATFDFRGWKNEFSYARREVYAVEADRNTDVHRAMVRKMIEIIRYYYSGDFNWESPRLGQVVVLSARAQDNEFLENFLLQEFFGSRGVLSR